MTKYSHGAKQSPHKSPRSPKPLRQVTSDHLDSTAMPCTTNSLVQSVLNRFHANRTGHLFYVNHRSHNSYLYEQQLHKVNHANAKKAVVLGLCLLIYIQVKAQGSASTHLCLGSRLCDALSNANLAFTTDNGTNPLTLPTLSAALEDKTQPELSALALASMQEAFLALNSKEITLKNKKTNTCDSFTFFTPPQQNWMYEKSFLCVMFNIHERALTLEKLVYRKEDEKTVLQLFTFIKNTVTNLSAIADHAANVLTDLQATQHRTLLKKFVCFLALNRIYFTLEKIDTNSQAQHFIRRILATMFEGLSFHRDFLFPTYFWMTELLSITPFHLFFNDISNDASKLIITTKALPKHNVYTSEESFKHIKLIDFIQKHRFAITPHEAILIENFPNIENSSASQMLNAIHF